jgi:hypothetical protein
MFQSRGDTLDEAMLFQVMPVGLAHFAAARAGRRGDGGTRLVRTLLMGQWFSLCEDLFGLQVGKFFIAVIAQEKRRDQLHVVTKSSELSADVVCARALLYAETRACRSFFDLFDVSSQGQPCLWRPRRQKRTEVRVVPMLL